MNRQDAKNEKPENRESPRGKDGRIELLMKALEREDGRWMAEHLGNRLWEADEAAQVLREYLENK